MWILENTKFFETSEFFFFFFFFHLREFLRGGEQGIARAKAFLFCFEP